MVSLQEQRLLDQSAVIENAPYLFQSESTKDNGLYGLKCASSQSQNCPSVSRDILYGLKCASSQSQNCPNSLVEKIE
jgi:hypothetical protein